MIAANVDEYNLDSEFITSTNKFRYIAGKIIDTPPNSKYQKNDKILIYIPLGDKYKYEIEKKLILVNEN